MTRSPERGPPPADAAAGSEGEAAWPAVERRAYPRHRVRLPATFIREDGARLAMDVIDISGGGLRLAGGGLAPGMRGTVAVDGLCGPLSCTVLGTDGAGLRLRLDAMAALRDGLVERLAEASRSAERD